ncbi:MAG: DUF3850 domain-containing protein [Clostridia bacterium]|nr:DUF3850 domain-containing protein [Clostridia bacterium]
MRNKHLKIKPEYFQAVIDGRKPFEIRKNDRKFKVGDEIVLDEYEGARYFEECDYYNNCDCLDDAYEEGFGEEEAIDNCQESKRLRCCEHLKHFYSGRSCLIKIKEIFSLKGLEELTDFVAFTFDIIQVYVSSSYVDVEEL